MQDPKLNRAHEIQPAPGRPAWRRPEVSILDVERGTVTTTGPVADGNGSTS